MCLLVRLDGGSGLPWPHCARGKQVEQNHHCFSVQSPLQGEFLLLGSQRDVPKKIRVSQEVFVSCSWKG